MKKKLFLLAATTALSVGALTFVLASSEKLGLSKNETSSLDSGVFTLEKSSIVRSATDPDVTQAVLLSSGNNSVNTTFKRAAEGGYGTLICDANDYITWSNNSDSPIRGISKLFFYFDAVSGDELDFWFYTSYNPLSLDNILAGDYQDLKVERDSKHVYSSGYTESFEYTFNEADSRYFLAVVICKLETTFTGFSISTPCDEEPSREDPSVGKYSYPQDVLDTIPTEAEFPFIGTGSFTYSINSGMVMIEYLLRYAQMQNFVDALEEANYEFATFLQGAYVYQLAGAPNGNYYTVVIIVDQIVSYGNLNFGSLMYYGEQPYMGASKGWPGTDLASHFSNNDLLDVLSHNPGYDDSYQFTVMSNPSDDSQYGAMISSGVEETEEAYLAQSNLIEAYRDYIIDLDKYILIENEFNHSSGETEVNINAAVQFVSKDLTHSIAVSLYFMKTSTNTSASIRYVFSQKESVTSFASYLPSDFFSKLQNPSFASENYYLLQTYSYSYETYAGSTVIAVSNTITDSEVSAFYNAFDESIGNCHKNTYLNSDGTRTYTFSYYDPNTQAYYSYNLVVGTSFVKVDCSYDVSLA